MSRSEEMLTKELVNEYYFSDIHTDRRDGTDVVIDGRQYTKWGTKTATTIVGNLYKIGRSVEPDKYLLLCGVARQSETTGFGITEEAAAELAAINAQINPKIMMEFDSIIDDDIFQNICFIFVEGNKKKLLKTEEEMLKNNA